MSWQALKAAWETKCRTHAQKLVLLRLADYADDEKNNESWPGVKSLARHCGLSERHIPRVLEELIKNGHISVIREPHGQESRHYLVHPRHHVTPDTVSPLTGSAATPDTVSPLPLTPCPTTPDTVSPNPLGTTNGTINEPGEAAKPPPLGASAQNDKENRERLFPRERQARIKALNDELAEIADRNSANASRYRLPDGKLKPEWEAYVQKLSSNIEQLETEERGYSRPDNGRAPDRAGNGNGHQSNHRNANSNAGRVTDYSAANRHRMEKLAREYPEEIHAKRL